MDDYLTPSEVARRLRVSVDAVRRWIRAGHLPAVRLVRRYLVRAADVETMLQPSDTPGGFAPPSRHARAAAALRAAGFRVG